MVHYDNMIEHPAISRIKALRDNMLINNIDWCVIYSADPHMSEYLGQSDKARQYFSGFTGSAGTLLVGQEETLLWTDSRYYVQAESELNGSGITLMKDGLATTPSVAEYLSSVVWEGQNVGLDLKTVSIDEYNDICERIPDSSIIVDAASVISKSWQDKPKRIFHPITVVEDDVAGKSTQDKLSEVRQLLEETLTDKDASYTYIVTDLCKIMWILNIRGTDIEYVPVAYSYMTIDRYSTVLYCNKKNIDKITADILSERGVIVKEYGNFYRELEGIATDICILDYKTVNSLIYSKVSEYCTVKKCKDTEFIRAHVKNAAEIEGMKDAHLKDAVVMIEFIKKLKEMSFDGEYNEYNIGKMLDNMRLDTKECEGLSFETICAYGENGAIVHYSAQESECKKIEDKGFLLVDSGGHYKMGTTDITRTISMGNLSQEQKKCYTLVLKANLRLMNARFKGNVRGDNLDIIARQCLWDEGYDYGHGTGHGVGCKLSVHEDPVRISYRSVSSVMEPGVIVSDEPGVYIENEFGIRLENVLLVIPDDNKILGLNRFESLTLVPFDVDAIDISEMDEEDIVALNKYHHMVYEKVSPYLLDETRIWLAKECEPLHK